MRLIACASSHSTIADGRPPWVPAAAWRRQDPLTKLACRVIASLPGIETLSADTALVCATSYGSIASTRRFVASMAEFGDAGASPTPFTTSVHNSLGGSIGEYLGLRGPATTISQGGTSCLACLRWADLLLRAGRATQVLIVTGECHDAWSERIVETLTPIKAAIGSGVGTMLVGTDGERTMRAGECDAEHVLDGGAWAASEQRLARDAAHQHRHDVSTILGSWWPTALFTALPHVLDQRPLQLREREGSAALSWWIGPPD